ncbi:MAG: hypothetical protein IJS13_07000 [Paludibacteraceae bacterium]|nr:hypothetical protein [Paludibacteraceae bacterium]
MTNGKLDIGDRVRIKDDLNSLYPHSAWYREQMSLNTGIVVGVSPTHYMVAIGTATYECRELELAEKTISNKKIYSHHELCLLAAEWLFKRGNKGSWRSCNYVAVEVNTVSSIICDVLGWGGTDGVQIECKVSRSDFLADKRKQHRQEPSKDMGAYRYFCCPQGIIKPKDLPTNWGLLYEVNGEIRLIVEAKEIEGAHCPELAVVSSVMRREGIKPQVFDYRGQNTTIKHKSK